MPEDNKALLSRFINELWNQNNLAIIDELVAADYVDHALGTSLGWSPGLEGLKRFTSICQAAFSDIQATVEEQIAEGDSVISRLTWRGTHTADLMGISPSGKQVVVTGSYCSHLSNSQIVAGWTQIDALGLLQQFVNMVPARPVTCRGDGDCPSGSVCSGGKCVVEGVGVNPDREVMVIYYIITQFGLPWLLNFSNVSEESSG